MINNQETEVISELRNISVSQEQFRARPIVDQDDDAIGEYALFGELTNSIEPRGKKEQGYPVMRKALSPSNNGYSTVSGYNYKIFLPHRGNVITDTGKYQNESKDQLSIDAQEKNWIVYAWPEKHRQKCFVSYNGGLIYSNNIINNHSIYIGNNSPAYNAAMSLKDMKIINSLRWSETLGHYIWESRINTNPMTGIDKQNWFSLETP